MHMLYMIYVSVYTCIYIYIYKSVYMCVYIYIYIYIERLGAAPDRRRRHPGLLICNIVMLRLVPMRI